LEKAKEELKKKQEKNEDIAQAAADKILDIVTRSVQQPLAGLR
jgi:hypothetical protein